MKTLVFMAVLGFSQLISAQKTVAIESFSSLAVGGNIQIALVPSTENKLVIGGGDEELDIALKNGKLTLGNESHTVSEVLLYYKGTINEIAVVGGCELASKESIKSEDLSIAIGGGSEVSIVVNTKKLNAAIGGGAELALNGKSKHFEATIGGGGELNASKLESNNVNIVVGGGAEASVFANQSIDANVGSGGELTIYGNPKKVNEMKADHAEITFVK